MQRGGEIELFAETNDDLLNIIEYDRGTITSQYLVTLTDQIAKALKKCLNELPRKKRNQAREYLQTLYAEQQNTLIIKNLYKILHSLYNFIYGDKEHSHLAKDSLINLNNILINAVMMQRECEWNELCDELTNEEKLRQALRVLESHAEYDSEEEEKFYKKWLASLGDTPSAASVRRWKCIIDASKILAREGNFARITGHIFAFLNIKFINNEIRIVYQESNEEQFKLVEPLNMRVIDSVFRAKKSKHIHECFEEILHHIDILLELKDRLAILDRRNLHIFFMDAMIERAITISNQQIIEQGGLIHNDNNAPLWRNIINLLALSIENKHIKIINKSIAKIRNFINDQLQMICNYFDIDRDIVIKLIETGFAIHIKNINARISTHRVQPTATNNLIRHHGCNGSESEQNEISFCELVDASGLDILDQPEELDILRKRMIYTISATKYIDFPNINEVASEAKYIKFKNIALMSMHQLDRFDYNMRDIIATISSPIYVNIFANSIDKHSALLCMLNFVRCHLSQIPSKRMPIFKCIKLKISEKGAKNDIYAYLDYFFLLLGTYRMRIWKSLLSQAFSKKSLSGHQYDSDHVSFKILFSSRISIDDNGMIFIEYKHTNAYKTNLSLNNTNAKELELELKHYCELIGIVLNQNSDLDVLRLTEVSSTFIKSMGLHFNKALCKRSLLQLNATKTLLSKYSFIGVKAGARIAESMEKHLSLARFI